MLLQLFGEMLTLLGGLIVAYFIYVLLARRNDKPSTDTPTMAHTALREIVERAVEEARKLPGLGGSGDSGRTQEGRNIAEHSYEDLLATAILNKVIEKFQREQVDGNSNVLREKPTSTKCTLSESELGLDEGVEEGSSSLEPLSQDECSSDCSASKHIRRQSEPLSLTIEERIEEVTTTYTSDEDHRDNDVLGIRNARRVPFPELGMDIIDPSQESSEDSQDESDTPTTHVDLVSPIESWEENWLFQKKKVQAQPDPVAMLVPNSSADYKALIGDKDAEDTSDLSECSSAQSDEEIEKELMEAINNVVPRSPRISESEVENKVEKNGRMLNDSSSKVGKEESRCNVRKIENGESMDDSSDLKEGKNRDKENEVCLERRNLRNQSEEGLSDRKESIEKCGIKDRNEMKVEEDIKNIMTEKTKDLQNQTTHNSSISIIPMNLETSTKTSNFQTKGQLKNIIIPKFCDEDSLSATESKDSFENGMLDSLEYSKTESAKDENIDSKLPKTPTPTPTRISVTEYIYEEANDSEIYVVNSEIVLNSLECAKKKLMDVDDVKREEVKDIGGVYKLDFHGEDEAQQESEYTEHYDIATQRHLDSLTKVDVPFGETDAINDDVKQVGKSKISSESENSKYLETLTFVKAESVFYQTLAKKTGEDDQLSTPPRPGTIAEREHKKWENAPPIENNPYSEESIQRRLWERQYSRRSADIPGVHTELPKSNGADLETVLEHIQPDITRFGRDYYINNSKMASGERTRRSTASASSRPSSSLSQLSSSTGADHEQQEEAQCRETEFTGRSVDVKSKVAKWQKNNDSSLQPMDRRNGYCTENTEEKYIRRNDSQRIWEDRVEDILENERKNNKNEINAKLNNQDTPTILETKKSFSDENQRKIRRIDLKAYGFENEFSFNKTTKSSPQRVVNKLDLKSFGYDGGLRRTQSNNHLDSTVNNTEFKPRIIRVTNKSNLTRCTEFRKPGDDLMEIQASGDRSWTKSTEALNKLLPGESYNTFGTMTAAKSVPDIARCEYYSNNEEESEQSETESTAQGSIGIKRDSKVKCEMERSEESTPIMQSENETDESSSEKSRTDRSEKFAVQLQTQEFTERNRTNKNEKKLPLPSVRRLAEAFNKQPEISPVPAPRVVKSNGAVKERSSTPEIHIVETPRQMHSLTARSLSKKFREGLRQIPNKVSSPPASHVAMEQTCVENQTEVVQSKGDGTLNDVDVISPGKLKSNIIFWEQMQKRS